MAVPGLIDLGAAAPWEPPAPRRRVTGLRQWIFAALVVALAGITGASAAPAQPLRDVFSASLGDSGFYAVDEDALYTLRTDGDGTSLTRYQLRDGAPQWTTPVAWTAGARGYADVIRTADLLVVITGKQDTVVTRTAAYDPATGRLQWTRAGHPEGYHPLPAPVALMARPVVEGCGDPPCDRPDLSPAAPRELVGVDPRTGVAGWSIIVASTTAYAFDEDHLVLFDRTGSLQVRAMATGTVLATRAVAPTQDQGVEIIGDQVYVHRWQVGGDTQITAHDRATLGPLWSTTLSRDSSGLGLCGALLCLYESESTRAVAPATGELRWELPGWRVGEDLGEGRLVALPAAHPQTPTEVLVVRADTGQRLFALSGWAPPPRWPVAFWPVARSSLVVRRDPSGTRLGLGRLDAARGEVSPIGEIPIPGDCFGAGSGARVYLICRTMDRRIRVLRYLG